MEPTATDVHLCVEMIDIIKGAKQLPWKLRISVMQIITKKKKLIIKRIARKIIGLFWSFSSNFLVYGYFGHFICFGGVISINLEVSVVFWSF